MPIFTPRTHKEVLRDLSAKVIARTDLSDINVGSSMFTLLNAIALEVANTESRMFSIRQSYSLSAASGEDLDKRVSELPPVGIRRKQSINGSGSVLTITKTNAALNDEIIIPVGTRVSKSSDGTTYRTASVYTIPAGTAAIEGVYIVAEKSGLLGNAAAGAINTMIDMPNGIESITNTIAINNGYERESDSSLRNRALRYINSLGRCSKSALEYIGVSYVSADNTSFKFARVYEDPTKPGYSELVVDDGSGLSSTPYLIQPDTVTTVGSGGAQILTHPRPSVRPINDINIVIERDGVTFNPTEEQFVSIPERGIIYFKSGVLEADDIVTIRNVFTYQGLFAELQSQIEGNINNGITVTGFRAAGTRVRVVPPNTTKFECDVKVVVRSGTDLNTTLTQVKSGLANFINELDIGQEVTPSQIMTHLLTTQNILSCSLFKKGTQVALDDVWPASGKHVLRATTADISVSTTF